MSALTAAKPGMGRGIVRILADQNIAQVAEAFAEFGEVRPVEGRALTPAVVADADMLLVRSVTRVDERLLAGSRVRFVASATSGTDHVDVDFLRSRAIHFADAPGSNAEAVAEYVLCGLLVRLAASGRRPEGLSAGIIGCGHVGSRVARKFEALGIRCLRHDPPLKDATGDSRYVGLDAALDADVVTLHVPLTRDGRHPTLRLIDAARLKRLRPEVMLINTARGGVIDEQALLAILADRPRMQVLIDCWEGEPVINRELLRRALIATPHIAGYSYDGKLRATETIHAAACAFFGRTPAWTPSVDLPAGAYRVDTGDDEEAVRRAVLTCYDVRADDAQLRRALTLPAAAAAGAYFDGLRRDYPLRREFAALTVTCRRRRERLAATLNGLGFRLRLVP